MLDGARAHTAQLYPLSLWSFSAQNCKDRFESPFIHTFPGELWHFVVQHTGAVPGQYETGLLVMMFPVLIIKSHIILNYAVYSPQQTVFNFIPSWMFIVLSKTLLPMVPLFHGRKTLTLPMQSCMRLGGNINPAYHCNKTPKQWLEAFSLVGSLGYFYS